MTLQVAPTHWYSWNFTVWKDSQPVASVDINSWCEKGALTVDRTDYQMYREGWMSGSFVLERDGSALARAERPSAFRRQFLIRYRDREYALVARSAFRRSFALLDGSQEIGSIEPTGVFTRDATADLPETWPLPLRAFVIWLTMIQWRRDSAAAGA